MTLFLLQNQVNALTCPVSNVNRLLLLYILKLTSAVHTSPRCKTRLRALRRFKTAINPITWTFGLNILTLVRSRRSTNDSLETDIHCRVGFDAVTNHKCHCPAMSPPNHMSMSTHITVATICDSADTLAIRLMTLSTSAPFFDLNKRYKINPVSKRPIVKSPPILSQLGAEMFRQTDP